ncbi:unnamed protein product [Chondrus crispus]|uniref:UBP-type domain-containing protein n=1 Tax=Chondrus crispus TaxID=2769 RepID=R7QMT1_CHOCR|nr:unnamed protein product [Chondrus crispus]CDF38791.1 unnamed protein product [Chondrus crispus]|eukprot:XP_005718696.1 unnamed protein product [Chondrus crispus]
MTSTQEAQTLQDDGVGFSVAPSPNCLHIASPSFEIFPEIATATTNSHGKAPRRNLYLEKCACNSCGDPEESWVCLSCGVSGCSRYKAGHMVAHANDAGSDHAAAVIAISLADLSIWCFACDDYITHPKLEPIFREFHLGKFGRAPTGELHSANNEAHGAVLTMETSATNSNLSPDMSKS